MDRLNYRQTETEAPFASGNNLHDDFVVKTQELEFRRERQQKSDRRQQDKERRQRRKKHREERKGRNKNIKLSITESQEKRLYNNDAMIQLLPNVDQIEAATTEETRDSEMSEADSFSCLCSHCTDGNTCTTKFRCFATTSADLDGKVSVTYGCLNEDLLDHAVCLGGNNQMPSTYRMQAICCTGELCNDVMPPELPAPTSTESLAKHPSQFKPLLFAMIPALLVILFVVIALYVYNRLLIRRQKLLARSKGKSYIGNLSTQPLTRDDTSIEVPDPTSGSGSGQTKLVQRTVAKGITLVDEIGRGKYGSVWRGIYQGSFVAIKIFLSKDEDSWAREHEIYTTFLLRHENILGFLASDVTSRSSVTQFWLIMHYHDCGSLYDYLNRSYTAVTAQQCLIMLQSAAAGLVHLHTEINGKQRKPAIAHRDVKSKNILVKGDGTCCIADLGLAVTCESGDINYGYSKQVGTKRYMAPEVLSETMNETNFESFKRADVYSFSLVMWETAICTIRHGFAGQYQMPYSGMVPADPTFEDMKRAVVTEKLRPSIPDSWTSDKSYSMLSKLIKECWSEESQARLTMLRIKKTLNGVYEEVKEDKKYLTQV